MRSPTENEIVRFESKYQLGSDGHPCWEWQAKRTHNGYGVFYFDHSTIYAHRFSFELYVGAIPPDYQIDHLCRNRACVRPEHLEAVTPRENLIRSEHPNMVAHVTDTCRHGHSLLDALKVKKVSSTGKTYEVRRCRACKKVSNQRRSSGGQNGVA